MYILVSYRKAKIQYWARKDEKKERINSDTRVMGLNRQQTRKRTKQILVKVLTAYSHFKWYSFTFWKEAIGQAVQCNQSYIKSRSGRGKKKPLDRHF